MIQRINIPDHQNLFHRGVAHLNRFQYTEAEELLVSSLEKNPASFSTYLNLATLYYKKQQYTDSLKMCDIGLRIKPYTSQAYYNRCLTLAKLLRFPQAASDIDCAISCCYLNSHQQNRDVQFLRKAIAYSPNNLEALQLMKCHYEELGENENINFGKGLQGYKTQMKGESKVKVYNICDIEGFRLFGNNYRDYGEKELKLLLKQKIKLYLDFDECVPKIKHAKNNQNNHREKCLTMEKTYQISISPRATLTPRNLFKIGIKNTGNHKTLPDESFTSSNNQYRERSPQILTSRVSKFTNRCHQGCLKCKSKGKENLVPQGAGIEVRLTTAQIFRGGITKPKPYCVIAYDGRLKETKVDFTGGHFPNWKQTFFFQTCGKAKEIRLKIFHQGHKNDLLIGEGSIQIKNGRAKCELSHGGKQTAYVYVKTSMI